MPQEQRLHIAYRTVLLAACLVVLGLIFREIVALLVATMITVIWAIPLSALATRLERHRVPRSLGTLVGLVLVAATLVGVLALVIPPLLTDIDHLVDSIPAIVEDLRRQIHETTGASSADIADRVQGFLRRYTQQPLRLVGPVASAGASVAGVIAALILMVVTAYYIAVRPQPLVDAAVRLFAPRHRQPALEVMQRIRAAWIGWLKGVAFDMVISGGLLYVGLRLIGLDFAVVFAVLTGLLVVVPYFGAIAAAIPPVLLGLTESPGRALAVLAVYLLVQEIEGHLIIPLVMSRTVKLHPAAIAIGVVVVGAVLGLPGLFVAVPILSAVTILTEEVWIRPLEQRQRRLRPPAELESAESPTRSSVRAAGL